MARSTPNQYPVELTDAQRERLERLTRTGAAPAAKVPHARVLLLSDGGRPGGRLTREAIAEALGMHVNTVDRLRKRFVREGEEPALNRKPRAQPPVPAKIDGRAEAHLVATCCSPAPAGHARWTLTLLAGELKTARAGHRGQHRDGPEGAEKNELQPWRKQSWCIPERGSARFVAKMEDILDLYAADHPADEPLVCMDEASKQLVRDDRPPLPAGPGRPAREDYHYERRGTQAIFCFFDPNRGWRRMAVGDSRTAVDWAEQVRVLLEEDYPAARKVTLVCDNLNTHTPAALYEAFPAEQARAWRSGWRSATRRCTGVG